MLPRSQYSYCHGTGRLHLPIRADSYTRVSNIASQFTGNEFQFKQNIKILVKCRIVYTLQETLLQESDQLKVVLVTCKQKKHILTTQLVHAQLESQASFRKAELKKNNCSARILEVTQQSFKLSLKPKSA